MATPALERPVPPSLRLPPISGLPARTHEAASVRESDVVTAYLTTTMPWYRRPVALPVSVVVAMWVVLGGASGVGAWLVAVQTGHAPCSGIACRIATLGHPGLLLVLAGICVATLLGLAPFTRGLTSASGPEVAVMTLAGIAGVGSLLGVVALVGLAVLAGFLTLALIVAVFEN